MTKLWLAFLLGLGQVACATTFKSEQGEDFTTNKIATIYGSIEYKTPVRFLEEMASTASLPGHRLILIDSDGGSVDAGMEMIRAVEAEKAKGIKIVCMVLSEAHSMAFNFLSHCDVRLATRNARMLVHPIFISFPPGVRLHYQELREHAKRLEQEENFFAELNARLMGLSRADYDKFANAETTWKAETLYKRGYLYGFGVFKK